MLTDGPSPYLHPSVLDVIEQNAIVGHTHPVDVIRLVDEVRRLRADLDRARTVSHPDEALIVPTEV